MGCDEVQYFEDLLDLVAGRDEHVVTHFIDDSAGVEIECRYILQERNAEGFV